MKKTLIKSLVLSVLLSVSFVRCASDNASDLESAEEALNAGDFQEAYDLASAVLADDPQNLEAARLTASSLFGLSNLDSTDLNSKLLDLQNSEDPNFAQIAAAVGTSVTTDYVVQAAETLRNCECTLDLDAEFQEGLYESYLSFVIGIVASGYNTGEENFDASAITDENVADVEAALVAFDDALLASGVEEGDDMLTQTREAYCLVTINTADESFDPGVYRALVGCELFEDEFTAEDIALLTDEVANCDELDPGQQDGVTFADGTTFDDCKSANIEE